MTVNSWIYLLGIASLLFLVTPVLGDTPLNMSNAKTDASGNFYWEISNPGSYYFDTSGSYITTNAQFATIIRASNVILDGRGKTINGGTVDSYNSNSYGIWFLSNAQYSGIQIKNLTIQNKTYGIQFGQVSNSRIENVRVNYNECGLFLFNSSNNVFTNIHADNNIMNGIYVASSSNNNSITLSTANSNAYGIEVVIDSWNNIITDNTASGNSQVGLFFSLNSSYNDILRNTALNNEWGIHCFQGCAYNDIVSNTVNSNTQCGIAFGDTVANNYNNVISNTAKYNGLAGILLMASNNNNISYNIVDSNTGSGIFVKDTSTHNNISQNTVTGSSYGIEISTNSDSCSVINNSINAATVVGIYVYGSSSNNVKNSTITNTGQSGILLNHNSLNNVIEQNHITGSQYGINIGDESNNNVVRSNNVTSQSVHVIYVYSSRNQNIYDNYFSGTAGIGGTNSISSWNTTKTTSTNIIGGPYIGGNFWAQPDNQGFSQITADANGDGICDSPNTLGYGYIPVNIDQLPLHQYVIQPNASVVSNTIPATMTPGQSYTVGVVMKNTGTLPWNETSYIRLGGLGDAASFGPTRITIPTGTTVAPGANYNFTFTMTAPSAAGAYTPRYMMVWDLHQWFGDSLNAAVTVGSPNQPDASVVSHNIPATMTPGQSYTVGVVMKNTGTLPWNEASYIRLGGLGDATRFGSTRITIPTGTTVAPGANYNFTLTITSPSTAGTYTPQYMMVWDLHQWFGNCLITAITVGNPTQPNASVVSNTIPATMNHGQSYTVGVVMKNTGTMPWNETSLIRLGGLDDATRFGSTRITVPTGTTVAPGANYNFTFTMTAPSTAGTYTPQYMMVWDLHQWFGNSVIKNIQVT